MDGEKCYSLGKEIKNEEHVRSMEISMAKKKTHYVDNEKFFAEIVEYKKKCKIAEKAGKEKPMLSEYIGKCIYLIAENLAHKPRFMNYSFVDEMKSDAIENCFMYFDNFDSDKYSNPFAYFTQIIYYAFHRRINKEERNRYIMYKKFQESVLETNTMNPLDGHVVDNKSLLLDSSDNHVMSTQMYDNINDFIDRFEKREVEKKEKRKLAKKALEKFIGDDDEGREQSV
jgi:hypothetical protein